MPIRRRSLSDLLGAVLPVKGATTTTSQVVSWKARSGATSYKVEYRQGSGSWVTAYTGTALTTTITGLTTATAYQVRITASVSGASSNTQLLSFTTS